MIKKQKICPKCGEVIKRGHNPKFCGGVKVGSSGRLRIGSEFDNKPFEVTKTNIKDEFGNDIYATLGFASGGIVTNAKGEERLITVSLENNYKSVINAEKDIKKKRKNLEESHPHLKAIEQNKK
jgi:hypothetical protein